MSSWKESAIDALHRSLYPVPQELNEIDWKGDLSNKIERLAVHLSAFANLANSRLICHSMVNL